MLRAAVKAGTPLGQRAKRYMDRGALVPDEVMIGIIRERLQEKDCACGFILDGFPRTIAQAEALTELLEALGKPIDHVVNIDVPEEELLRRLSGRLTCQNCGAMFNVILEPPRVPGRCDRCGGALIQRADDRAEPIHERLTIHRKTTPAIMDYYRVRALLRTVDGTGTINDIAKRIAEAVSG